MKYSLVLIVGIIVVSVIGAPLREDKQQHLQNDGPNGQPDIHRNLPWTLGLNEEQHAQHPEHVRRRIREVSPVTRSDEDLEHSDYDSLDKTDELHNGDSDEAGQKSQKEEKIENVTDDPKAFSSIKRLDVRHYQDKNGKKKYH